MDTICYLFFHTGNELCGGEGVDGFVNQSMPV